MTSAVAVVNTGPAVAVQGNFNPFEAYAEAANTSRIVGDLLKFSKGDYSAGQSGDEVPEGTQLAANMGEFYVGWVKWVDGKPAEQMMGRIADGYVPQRRSDLGDHDKGQWEVDAISGQARDPWQITNYLVMMDPKSGSSTRSPQARRVALGRSASWRACTARTCARRLTSIRSWRSTSTNTSTRTRAFGIIKTPKFDVVGWVDKSIFDVAMAAAAAGGEEEAPFKEAPAPVKGKGAKISITRRHEGRRSPSTIRLSSERVSFDMKASVLCRPRSRLGLDTR
jgi:hypothetical protein